MRIDDIEIIKLFFLKIQNHDGLVFEWLNLFLKCLETPVYNMAREYSFCLPDKALLQQKLREWIEEYKKFNEKKG